MYKPFCFLREEIILFQEEHEMFTASYPVYIGGFSIKLLLKFVRIFSVFFDKVFSKPGESL